MQRYIPSSKQIKVIATNTKPIPINIKPSCKFIVDDNGIVRCVRPGVDQ
jgi:hypothetical protein